MRKAVFVDGLYQPMAQILNIDLPNVQSIQILKGPQGTLYGRNTNVRGYLTSNGVPDEVITSQAFGEANPCVPTADGVRELQNRRVEITYGPGSGW